VTCQLERQREIYAKGREAQSALPSNHLCACGCLGRTNFETRNRVVDGVFIAKGTARDYLAGHERRDKLASELKWADLPTWIDTNDRDLEETYRVVTAKLAKPSANGVAFVRQFQDLDGTLTLLHRVIGGRLVGHELDRTEVVIHSNGDGLDNRRENLQVISIGESNQNAAVSRANTSGFKNVAYSKSNKAYSAYINVDKVRHHLGFHATAERANEAVIAFKKSRGKS
jgi:hypothetical protein